MVISNVELPYTDFLSVEWSAKYIYLIYYVKYSTFYLYSTPYSVCSRWVDEGTGQMGFVQPEVVSCFELL